MLTVTPAQATALINDCLFNPTARVVPILKGAPGTGKSSIYRSIAAENNLLPIDLRLSQLDPTDLLGLPDVRGDKASYLPFDTFPLQGDSLPVKPEYAEVAVEDRTEDMYYAGWLIIFDELPDASRAVQSAAYKPLLDRMIGQSYLHDKAYCVAAGNRVEDKAGVSARMGTAMQSRLVHLNIGIDKDGWIEWATKKGFHSRITSFIEFKPECLNKFDANHTQDTFSCQRTLEFLHNVTNHMETITRDKLPLLAGCVSEPVARDFLNFVEYYQGLPKYDAIIADPMGTAIPSEPGVRYAMVGMLASHVDKTSLDQCLQYVDRLSADFRLLFIRQAYLRNKTLVTVPKFMALIREIRGLIAD